MSFVAFKEPPPFLLIAQVYVEVVLSCRYRMIRHLRINWFKRGYKYGDLNHGDTFNEKDLNLSTAA